ncbi:MAG: 50S ribosomal protein L4 [Chloroflexi bacterium]|nr:50S ribosomal protein L4 [Chloroflexota bacterium]MCY3937721.1 50S ribosomal protein L4 [Chloroflexota bacterium]
MSGEGKDQPYAAVRVLDPDGAEAAEIEVPAEILTDEPHVEILQRAIVDRQANMRRGTQSVKNRSEVRGGGRKPWRQKGTGRARHGSIRSPIWRGGGKALNAQPRSFSRYLNRRERRQAFASALSLKLAAGRMAVVDSLELSKPGTKQRVKWLDMLDLKGDILLVDQAPSSDVIRSTANLRTVSVARADTLSAYEILAADHLVLSKAALAALRRTSDDGLA